MRNGLGVFLAVAVLSVTGCNKPKEGDPCDTESDVTSCVAKDGDILFCSGSNSPEWITLGCKEVCSPKGWSGECGFSDNKGNDVCWCTGFLLTCHDGRPGFQQCVHYTFDSQSDRDSFYDQCAGLTSRTKDAHNCPTGATGDGYCVHTTSTRRSETFTYNGTSSELKSRCSNTDGSWQTDKR